MSTSIRESWPSRQLLITQRLRLRRAELGLTQKQVVTRLARSGVRTTNRTLSSLEHGAGLDVAKLPELAVALDCTVTYLVGLTDEPHRWEPDLRHAEPDPTPAESPVSRVPARSWILGEDVPDRGSRLTSGGGSGLR